MKKVLMILAFIMVSVLGFSQSQRYYDARALYRNNGYAIGIEKQSTISQGNWFYNDLTFQAGYEYIIVAMSDDVDVTDVDLYVNYTDGSAFVKDTDSNRISIVRFTFSYTTTMRICVKNYKSLTPNYESTHRFFVAYR